jgi:hypothetical protein
MPLATQIYEDFFRLLFLIYFLKDNTDSKKLQQNPEQEN